MFLNVDDVGAERMSSGRLFQANGPATQNARLPNCSLVLGTTKSPGAVERREQKGLIMIIIIIIILIVIIHWRMCRQGWTRVKSGRKVSAQSNREDLWKNWRIWIATSQV